MKKVLLLACLLLLIGCGKQMTPIEFVEKNFGFHIPSDVYIRKIENSFINGLHGDGHFYLEAQLEKDRMPMFLQVISQSEKWKELPLPEAMQKYYRGSFVNRYMKLKNGYYYFQDIPEEGGYNIAVLNLDTNELFVYKQVN
ncbi:MAG: hypothetical protein HZA49_08105 [Planctomycetes bacterium]|nr:hypothetical protein [Planctomycetota bacterium]